jgi:Tol biopolymer transport system component
MMTGKRAFQKKTGAETLSAIIRDDPEPVAAVNPGAPPPLQWLLERCLAKEPEGRYASTKDLARDLTSIQAHLSGTAVRAGEPRSRRGLRMQTVLTVSLALAVVVLGALLVLKRPQSIRGTVSSLRFRQVTFEEQGIMTARFAPDGETFVYGAYRQDKPADLFMARVGNPESRPLGIPEAQISSISASGQMAFLLGSGDATRGTLAEAALAGGAPRKLLENVREADWSSDGKTLAVVHAVDGRDRLEFPVGRVLYERPASAQSLSGGWGLIRGCRVSPKGDRIAFIEAGRLTLVDEHGKLIRLSQAGDCNFFDWSPGGEEIWYAKIEGGATELRALTPGGRDRLLTSLAGDFQLHDVSRTGRILLEKGTNLYKVFGRLRGDAAERNLAHLSGTEPVDLSADGSRLLFNEIESYGTNSTVYLREAGKPPVRIGRGYALALSPDGNWVITTRTHIADGIADEIILIPTGPGEPHRLPNGGLKTFGGANWLPDGKRIVFAANAASEKPRLYVQNVAGGLPKPITPQGVTVVGKQPSSFVSPDGQLVLGSNAQGPQLYPVDGGDPRPVRGLESGEWLIQWSEDGRRLFVRRRWKSVFLLDPFSGERKLFMELPPIDPDFWLARLVLARNGKSYVRLMMRYTSNLFVLDGIQ